MREICNDLIMRSQKFVVGEEIFQVEPPEAVEKLKTTLKVCGTLNPNPKPLTLNPKPETLDAKP